MKQAFGFAMLLFMGYPFALAGHYDLYNKNTERSNDYFPPQEQVVILIMAILAVSYVIIALM